MRLLSNRAAVLVVAVVMAVVVPASILAGEKGVEVASSPASAPAITADKGFSEIPRSFKPTTDVDMGEFSSSQHDGRRCPSAQ